MIRNTVKHKGREEALLEPAGGVKYLKNFSEFQSNGYVSPFTNILWNYIVCLVRSISGGVLYFLLDK